MKPTELLKLAMGMEDRTGEDLNRMTRMVLTREETRAEADELFGGPAKEMRKKDKAYVDRLFVQAPASQTMAPNLQKEAYVGADDIVGGAIGYHYGKKQKERGEKHTFGVPQAAGSVFIPGGLGYQVGRYLAHSDPETKRGKVKKSSILSPLGGAAGVARNVSHNDKGQRMRALPSFMYKEKTPGNVRPADLQKTSGVELMKLAVCLASGPDGGDTWLKQFEGTDLLPHAIELEEQSLQMEQEDIQRRAEEDARYKEQDISRQAQWQKRDQLHLDKRMLALELAKQQAGIGSGDTEAPAEEVVVPQEAAVPAPQPEATPPGMPPMAKTSSVASHVEAYFEKRAYLPEAYRRYPELLKAAASDTKPAPDLKSRVTTPTSGRTPVRSNLSGGSA